MSIQINKYKKPDFTSGFFVQNDLNWKVCRSIKNSTQSELYTIFVTPQESQQRKTV
ncbi:hypothetical protein HMPREF0204_12401 [Chryseobacterium gleum ATCC 35910]|uniref:Uncharacterized protein n=1 Tax=Chryseobacterium gleum ATCC 35910 TaxID=525257 RepID=A0ABP2IPS6_CHRGE|nr:hypothetical protein HMPREF0204_12401 [Chryseobacterium gleum ATCC 35910]